MRGVGIGALCSRVFARQFAQTDLTETIRLAVDRRRHRTRNARPDLVATYATDRPLVETYPSLPRPLNAFVRPSP